MSKNRMRSRAGALTTSLMALVVSLTMVGAIACAPAEEGGDTEARQAAFAAMEEAQEALQAQRAELAELGEKIAAGVESIEVPEGAEQTAEEMLEEMKARRETLEGEVTAKADELMSQIVTFINEDPWIEGEEKSELQAGAVRLKSTEDLVLAMEYVEEGGDYKRAADIINRALEIDPDNQDLLDRLAWVEEMRFMTEDRFSGVEIGMTEAQVREILGPPNLNNVREFEGGRIGWFFPRGANAAADGAAGVYFQPERGVLKVYEANFDAVKPQQEG